MKPSLSVQLVIRQLIYALLTAGTARNSVSRGALTVSTTDSAVLHGDLMAVQQHALLQEAELRAAR